VQITGTALCYAVNAIDDQFDVINDGKSATLPFWPTRSATAISRSP